MTTLSFFLAWLRRIRYASAPCSPSSPALADAITAEITPACAPVIELGPGTGVFTHSLIRPAFPEERHALIERGRAFAREARSRSFPRARVLQMDAARLVGRSSPFDGERAGAVVERPAVLLMTPHEVLASLEGAFDQAAAGRRVLPVHVRARAPGVPAASSIGSASRSCARAGRSPTSRRRPCTELIRRRYAYARRAAASGSRL